MTSGGSLDLTAREMITLSRLFMSTRRMGDSWLGVATPDERQVSILSQNAAGDRLVLKSITHGRIDKTLLKIPVDYKRLQPDLPVLPKEGMFGSKTTDSGPDKGSKHLQ